jgi:hypothetical protein
VQQQEGLACVCFAVDRLDQGEALIDAADIAGRAAQVPLRDTAQPCPSQATVRVINPAPIPTTRLSTIFQ